MIILRRIAFALASTLLYACTYFKLKHLPLEIPPLLQLPSANTHTETDNDYFEHAIYKLSASKKMFIGLIYKHFRHQECGFSCMHVIVHRIYSNQWGRRLEVLSNTAARLAGCRRVTRQVWLCMWWTGRTACLFRTVPVALTWAAQLQANRISSCCYKVNVHNHWSSKEGMAWWYSSRPMPSLWQ